MKILPISVVSFVWLLVGFGLKAALETAEIARFIQSFGLVIVIVSLAILLVIAGIVVVSILLQSRHSDKGIVASFVDWFETRIATPGTRKRASNKTPLTDLAMWIVRRQKGQFYLNITVSLVGALLGAATLFTLYQQDARNTRDVAATAVAPPVLAPAPAPAPAASIPAAPEPAAVDRTHIKVSRHATVYHDVAQIEEVLTFVPFESRVDCAEDSGANQANCWVRDLSGNGRDMFLLPDALRKDVADFLDSRSNSDTMLSPFATAEQDQGRVLRTLARNRISPEGLNFQSAQLASGDLSDARLIGLQAPNSDLTNTKLKSANLTDAVLNGSTVSNAYFFESRMARANMSDIRGDRMFVSASDMNNANFSNARLTNLHAIDSNMAFARFDDTVLHNAKLKNVLAQNAQFQRADLSHSSMVGGNFKNAVFLQSVLRHADLSDAGLMGANISRADFTSANVTNTDFTGAWTWSDMPPIGLPDNIDIASCRYVDSASSRTVSQRPDTCGDS